MLDDKLQVTINLTEAQYRLLIKATDMVSRVHQGQFFDILNEALISSLVGLSTNDIRVIEKELKDKFFPGLELNSYHGIYSPEIDDRSRVLFDMHQSLRYALAKNDTSDDKHYWGVYLHEPLKTSRVEELMQVTLKKEEL